MKKSNFKKSVISSIYAILILMVCLLKPWASTAQTPAEIIRTSDSDTNIVGTSDSRMAITIVETDSTVQLRVMAIGQMTANGFGFTMSYDTTKFRLCDSTYARFAPSTISGAYNWVKIEPSFVRKYRTFTAMVHTLDDLGMGGRPTNGKYLYSYVSSASTNVPNDCMKPVAGEMIPVYSIFFKKAVKGVPLSPSDLIFYVNPRIPYINSLWGYGPTSIANGRMPVSASNYVRSKQFLYRSPSIPAIDSVNNLAATTATLNGTFSRGNFIPSNSMTVSSYSSAADTGRLNFDSIRNYGFIYSSSNVELSVKEFTDTIVIDGINYPFPTPSEINTDGTFTRGGYTFFIKETGGSAPSAQKTPSSWALTGLTSDATYYAWPYLHFSFETSGTYPEIGNKIEFKTGDCDPPATPIASNAQSFCGTPTVADLVANVEPGSRLRWYDAANKTGIDSLTSGTPLATGTTYYARAYMSDVCLSDSVEVTVTIVNDLNAPTATTPQEFCETATVANLQATGTNIKWYSSLTGGTALSTTDLLDNDSVYYASQSAGTCESTTRTAVKVIINDVKPIAPVIASPQNFCGSGTLADIATDGNTNIVWYATNGSTTELPLTTPLASSTYYAAISAGNCESATRTPVTITMNPVKPVKPVITTPQSFCNGATIANIKVPNNQIEWYATNNAADTIPLDPSTLLADGATYYAAQKAGECERSDRAAVVITIDKPEKPSVPSQVQQFCNEARIRDLQVSGSGVKWYTVTGTGPLALDDLLSDGSTYAATQTSGSCEGDTIHVRVLINTPTIAVRAGARDTAVCANGAVTFNLGNMILSRDGGDSTQYSTSRDFATILPASQVNAYSVSLNDSSKVYVRLYNTITGCITANNKIDSIKMKVNANPVANFTYEADAGNAFKINFTNNSAPTTGLTYQWDFGDLSSTSSDKNPTHTYAVSGKYTVKLTVSNGNCEATAEYEVTVGAIIAGGFSVNAQSQCSVGNRFVFTNLTTITGSAVSYLWTFGDDSISTEKDPAHIYTTSGEYTVKMVAESTDPSNPAKDSAEMTVYVVPTPNVTNAINHEYCSGVTAPTHYFTGDVAGTTYQWYRIIGQDIDETGLSQNIGRDSIPSFVAHNEGYIHMAAAYKVTPYYTVNNYACQGQGMNYLITVNPVPVVAPVANQVYCAGQEVSALKFTGNNTNTTSFKWQYVSGDQIAGLPSSGNTELPKFIAENNGTTTLTGTYKVTPSYTHANTVCEGNAVEFTISILPKVALSSNLIMPSICSGTGINYTLASATAGVTYNWRRLANSGINEAPRSGTGAIIDTLTNNKNKIVNVEYLVTLNNGQCNYSEIVNVSVYPATRFTNAMQVAATCNGSEFTTVLNTNVLDANIAWKRLYNADINNGTTSSGATALISETLNSSSATSTVVKYALTATANGCTKYDTMLVTVSPKLTLGAISNLFVDTICSGSEVLYNLPQTTGISYAWQRTFNQNLTPYVSSGVGRLINEVIVNNSDVAQTAIYSVALNSGQCSGTDQIQVLVLPAPKADFAMDLSGVGEIKFTNTSTGATAYAWNFGDGQTSTIKDPIHKYTKSGTYTVKLVATNAIGCEATISKTISVSTTTDLSARFTVNTKEQCLTGNSFIFNNISKITTPGYSIDSYKWYFGDDSTSTVKNPIHEYKKAGVFTVTLEVTESPGGTKSSYSQTIRVMGKPAITLAPPAAVCAGEKLAVTAPMIDWQGNAPVAGTWLLDGNIFDLNTAMTTSYNGKALTYKISTACDTSSSSVNVTVYDLPVADFSYAVDSIGKIAFTDLSQNAASYKWNFGDGQTSTETNPKHQYTQSGTYVVTLTVTSANGCTSTITKTVSVNLSLDLVADFTVNLKEQCLSDNIFVFNNMSKVSAPYTIGSYLWNFGDGATSTAKSPTHTYAQAGNYTVTLAITEASGGTKDSVSQTIKVLGKPRVTLTEPAAICAGERLSIENPTIEWQGSAPANGTWLLNNQIFDINRTMTVADSGKVLTYHLFTACGDTISNAVTVKVYTPAVANFSTVEDSIGRIAFKNLSKNATEYAWDFGDGSVTSVEKDPKHQYASSGTYTVTLTATNNGGCTSTITRQVTVVIPSDAGELLADFTVDKGIQCLGDNSFVFTNTSRTSKDVTYLWSFGDGVTSTDKNPTHTYSQIGSYTVTLTVTETVGTKQSTYSQTVQVVKSTAIVQQPEAQVDVCEADGFSLSIVADGYNLRYQWYKDGNAITGATKSVYEVTTAASGDFGTYTVEVTGECGTIMSQASKVQENNVFILAKWDDVLLVSRRDSEGNKLEFKSYQWYKMDSKGNMVAISEKGNSQYYSEKDLSGTFAVKVIYADGTSQMSCPYTLVPVQKVSVKIYPNPATVNEKINVVLGARPQGQTLIEVYDVLGRVVAKTTVDESTAELYLNVATGTYMFRVTDSEGRVTTEKVVINK